MHIFLLERAVYLPGRRVSGGSLNSTAAFVSKNVCNLATRAEVSLFSRSSLFALNMFSDFNAFKVIVYIKGNV